MECKFIKHGIALSYDQIIKPCCDWQISDAWRETNNYQTVELVNWHQSPQVLEQRRMLDDGQWPKACIKCEKMEAQSRSDSMRGNGNQAYSHYKNDDITLEIRPGSTCNFACQTCWPAASSRVAQYYNQAGLINIENLNSNRMNSFDFLLPIADRIQDVVLLGGEPFYDKSCIKFLEWAQKHLTSNLMMFTNGSVIDLDFLKNYSGKLTLIFSLDAVGRAAEYIRYGTEWTQVLSNYLAVKSMDNVDIRVNITCSIYNYIHMEKLIEFLCQDWPSVVTFGVAFQEMFTESSVPKTCRDEIIQSLERTVDRLKSAQIPTDQKSNAVNAVASIINNLRTVPVDVVNHTKFINFVEKMDRVKQIRASDYCEFLGRLQQPIS